MCTHSISSDGTRLSSSNPASSELRAAGRRSLGLREAISHLPVRSPTPLLSSWYKEGTFLTGNWYPAFRRDEGGRGPSCTCCFSSPLAQNSPYAKWPLLGQRVLLPSAGECPLSSAWLQSPSPCPPPFSGAGSLTLIEQGNSLEILTTIITIFLCE